MCDRLRTDGYELKVLLGLQFCNTICLANKLGHGVIGFSKSVLLIGNDYTYLYSLLSTQAVFTTYECYTNTLTTYI